MSKKKFKNWLDKPFTRRDYLKLCGYALGASALYYAAFFGYLYRNEICDIATEAWNKFTRKEKSSEDVELEIDN